MNKIILVLILFGLVFGCVGTESNSGSFGDDIINDQNTVSDSNPTKNPLKSGYVISNDENFIIADSIRIKAINEKNAELCKQIDYLSVKENCFLNVAVILKDKLICNEIDSNNTKNDCFSAVQRRS